MGAEETNEPLFPLQGFLGFEIEHRDGEAVAVVDVDDRHLNPNGVVHGAVPFALMDTAMGGAVMSVVADGQYCATIEMQTRFHRPVNAGRLTAAATVLAAGRRIIHLEARVSDDSDRLVASATASFAVLTIPD